MNDNDINDIEALWSLKFGTTELYGAGVTVFETKRVFGGDSLFFWTGEYTIKDAVLTALVHVEKHVDGGTPIIPLDSYDLAITGKMKGGTIQAVGTVVGHPDLPQVALIFAKLAPLPP